VFLIFWKFEISKIALLIFVFSKHFKLIEGKNEFDFSSNIEHAKKSMAKVMNHRIEKLSTMLDEYETQLNVSNKSPLSIECENEINESSDNSSCSSTINVEPLLLSKSKRFKVNSSIRKCTSETSNTKFSNSTQLNIHHRVHTKQKRFTCDQCEKTFSQRQYLSKHTKLHTGEKPYQCGVCQKKFSDSSCLLRHKRTHTGERPYHCDSCDKKFSQSQHLTQHKRMHTGEKPYSCSCCDKKFSQLTNLITHKRTHT
jgi:uncharacterized Zn-finger protein